MRDGFKLVDCDGHILEPLDIWDRYVEPKYIQPERKRPFEVPCISRPSLA